MAVVIFGFWNVPGVRNFIIPLKMFSIGLHEMCHVIAVSILSHAFRSCPSHVPLCPLGKTGYNYRRIRTKDNNRPSHRRMYDCRRRVADIHTLIRIHRLRFVGRTIRACRMGHAGSESDEFCARSWVDTTAETCTR
jgi:hypothetical protein